MSRYLLQHRHAPHECGVVFASWRGHGSPLPSRRGALLVLLGGHAIWWQVEADSEGAALGLLPSYVAERTTVHPISEVRIP